MEEIAIKVPKLSNFSTDSVRDFYDEAKTALQFNHENVLRCWGISMGKNHNTNRDIGTFPCKLAGGSGYYHEMVEVIMSKGNGIYYEW